MKKVIIIALSPVLFIDACSSARLTKSKAENKVAAETVSKAGSSYDQLCTIKATQNYRTGVKQPCYKYNSKHHNVIEIVY